MTDKGFGMGNHEMYHVEKEQVIKKVVLKAMERSQLRESNSLGH